ncbi:MAG: rhodanese-like domain-containing protein [Demequinaceae bacterium]|nr:rhodanese-like domain-containing protein [Demequinaceae bacterium]
MTRTLRSVLIATIAAVALSACSSEPAGPPAFDGSHVGASSFAAATEVAGVTVIDVRTPAEFAEGHIPGAVNINVEDPSFAAAIAQLDPAADYAVYCRSGNRSRAAMELMTQAGVAHTVGLEGGIVAWKGDIQK